MPIDFNALNNPDYVGALQGGIDAGRRRALDERKQNALQAYATNPDAGIQQLAGVDPMGAAQLQGLQDKRRAEAARQSAATKFGAGDMKGARTDALTANDPDFLSYIDKSDAETRQAIATTAWMVRQRPAAERPAIIAQIAQGSSPEMRDQVAGLDYSDAGLDTIVGRALGVKVLQDQAEKAADNDRADRQLEETGRHNRVTEGSTKAGLEIRRHPPARAGNPNAIKWD